MAKEFYYRWQWDLESSPRALWPLVADTNRFNKDAGLPPVERATGEALRNARRQLRFFKLGVEVAWEEEPFQWVEPRQFSVVRRYAKGPIAELRVAVELIPQAGGTRLVYEVWARPGNMLGRLAIPIEVGLLTPRRFAAVFRGYDRLSVEGAEAVGLASRGTKVGFASGGQRRLQQLRGDLLAEGLAEDGLARLADLVEKGDDLTVRFMRPYEMADIWGLERANVLALFLQATRGGLLQFEWDLLCPLCRGAKATSVSLAGIVPQVHCDTCNIDFEVNFDRSVELTFHPNPSIRSIDIGEFCIAGPRVTPHVAVQQLLAAGECRALTPTLERGRYRVRALGLQGGQFVQVGEAGPEAWDFIAGAGGWTGDEVHLGVESQLHFVNETDAEQLFILERLALADQATTAAEVTALQVFRDLFADEALRPGERISVGSLTVIFTDLYGSTELYNQIGDATAFGLVMRHFDILRAAIVAEGGAEVKTMGDAVMAVFQRPVSGLRALLRAQEELAHLEAGDGPFTLKAGMHYGPCIAVTLNGQLDYFGSTVNIAARLEGLSEGGDVVVSSAVHDDPEIADFLSEHAGDFAVDKLDVTLKGFYEERFALKRVRKLG